jgi:hypothetical protein
MHDLPSTLIPVKTQVDEHEVAKVLGCIISNYSDPYQAFIYPPNGSHEIHASAELEPEERSKDGKLRDKVKCKITRRATNYQAIFDSIWEHQKSQIRHLLDLEKSAYMVVTAVSDVELPVESNLSLPSSQPISIAKRRLALDPNISVQDISGELRVDPDWFEREVAKGESLRAIEVRKVLDKKNIMSHLKGISDKVDAMLTIKPELSPHLVQDDG